MLASKSIPLLKASSGPQYHHSFVTELSLPLEGKSGRR